MVDIKKLPGQPAPIALAMLLFIVTALAQQAKPAPPNKARDLIEQAVQALGGPAYLEVKQFIREGRLYGFDRGELSSPGEVFTEYVKLPDKSRFERGKKRNLIYINDGAQGWELDPQGIRQQTPEAIADFQASVRRDIDNLLRRRRTEPGVAFYFQGSEFVDNRRVDIIEMVDTENESYFFYLDAQTHFPTQLRYRERDTLTGEMVDVIERYGTYINSQGIQTARQITRERARRRVWEAFDLKVQYNTNLPDELFTRDALEVRWREISKKQKPKKESDD